jgi:hypothetical protein
MRPTSIMGRHQSSKVNAKEYRIFEFPVEGIFGNGTLPGRAASFRMISHS